MMTTDARKLWEEKLLNLETRVSELKREAVEGLDTQSRVGSHPVVCGLAAIEGLVWGLRDAVGRFPTPEQIDQDAQQNLL